MLKAFVLTVVLAFALSALAEQQEQPMPGEEMQQEELLRELCLVYLRLDRLVGQAEGRPQETAQQETATGQEAEDAEETTEPGETTPPQVGDEAPADEVEERPDRCLQFQEEFELIHPMGEAVQPEEAEDTVEPGETTPPQVGDEAPADEVGEPGLDVTEMQPQALDELRMVRDMLGRIIDRLEGQQPGTG